MTMIVEPPGGSADKSCAVDRTSEAFSSSSPPDLRECSETAVTDVSLADDDDTNVRCGTQRAIKSSLGTSISANCFVLLTKLELDCAASVSPCRGVRSAGAARVDGGGRASSPPPSPGHGEEPRAESNGESNAGSNGESDGESIGEVNGESNGGSNGDGGPAQQEMPYACDVCQARFRVQSRLFDHHNFVHSREAFVVCDCGKELTRLSYYGHLAKHNDHKCLKCCRCGMRFRLMKELRQHMADEGHGEVPLVCCRKEYSSRGYFAAHLRRTHACEALQDSQGNAKFLCKHCWQEFRTLHSAIEHQKQDHPAKLEADGEGLPASESEVASEPDVEMSNGNAVAPAKQRGRSFGGKASELVPRRSSFLCQVCGAAFPRRQPYLAHLKGHSAEKQRRLTRSPAPPRRALSHLSCQLCGDRFRTAMALKLHYRQLHSRSVRATRGSSGCGGVRDSTGPPRLPASRASSKAWDDTSSRSSDCSAGGDVPAEDWRSGSPSESFFLSLSRPDCRFRCSLCPASFDLRVFLESHMRNHVKKAYSCTECRMLFSDHVSRTVHFLQNH